MKKTLLSAFFIAGLGIITNAQCDKKTALSSSKTEFLDSNYNVKDTKDENTTVEFSKNDITIIPGGQEDQKLTGTIKSFTCDWKVPFKEGKTVIKTTLVDPRGDEKKATITIEGKDGKITFLGEIDEMPDMKLRLTADKFEEKS